MSDELGVTRRGLLQMVGAVVMTASYAARRPLFGPSLDDVMAPDDAALTELPVHDGGHGRRLDQFLRSRSIRPAHLARESGYSRQHLLRIRLGRMTPTHECMVAIVTACRRLARDHVRASDLFEITPAEARTIERSRRLD